MKTRFIPTGLTKFNPRIPNGKGGFREIPEGLFEVYVDFSRKVAIFYTGKQSKHTWYNRFQTCEDLEKKIIKTASSLLDWEDKKVERKEARKAPTTVKVGDIFYTSWGYDQTNVNFYKVVSVKGRQTVELQEIGSKIVSTDGGPSTHVIADPKRLVKDKTLTKRVVDNKIKIESYATGWLWGGKPVYETASGWGH